jgi:hypothetical protein
MRAPIFPSRRVAPLALCLALLADCAPAWGQPSDGPPPFSGPEAEAVDGLPALKKLVDGGRLKLSLDETSAADTFYFGLVAYLRTPQAGTQSTEMAVWREGQSFLFWSWARDSKNSVPTCAVTDGLFVGLDLKNPGGVVLFEGGHPEVASPPRRTARAGSSSSATTPPAATPRASSSTPGRSFSRASRR